MARRRFYRSRGFARRAYRGARRFGGRSRGMFGNQFVKWGAGAAAGVLAPQFHPLQDLVITALAIVPVRLPYGIKTLAQGYVGGRLIRPFLGGVAGLPSASSGGVDYV